MMSHNLYLLKKIGCLASKTWLYFLGIVKRNFINFEHYDLANGKGVFKHWWAYRHTSQIGVLILKTTKKSIFVNDKDVP
jgi:hypothetical protein